MAPGSDDPEVDHPQTGDDPSERSSGPLAGMNADQLTTSLRDPAELGRALVGWLASRLPTGAAPELVGEVETPSGNGMSSETLLFTVRWQDGGEVVQRRCVARIEPDRDQSPVFPRYDLAMQYRVMELVGRHTAAPVPRTLWLEEDETVIGSPFFVMERVDGQVPQDVLPYTFGDTWLDGTTPDQWRQLQRSALSAVAEIHRITPAEHDLSFLGPTAIDDGRSVLDRHLSEWEDYLHWVTGDDPGELLPACFTWLRDHLPDAPDARLSWGDARIGNMLFAGHEVAAVLDWEMAALAPPQVDLGWMIYLHQFFQDITTDLGLPGLPDVFRTADTAATYRELTGRDPGDLRWYVAYCAMRHGVIMRRVTDRSIQFGEAVRPDNPDDTIIHRRTLEEMLDGSYWDRVPD